MQYCCKRVARLKPGDWPRADIACHGLRNRAIRVVNTDIVPPLDEVGRHRLTHVSRADED
jgi:hypothetical protein